MIWWKFQAFQLGISPREFNKCTVKEIIEMFMLQNATKNKQHREAEINKLMNQM